MAILRCPPTISPGRALLPLVMSNSCRFLISSKHLWNSSGTQYRADLKHWSCINVVCKTYHTYNPVWALVSTMSDSQIALLRDYERELGGDELPPNDAERPESDLPEQRKDLLRNRQSVLSLLSGFRAKRRAVIEGFHNSRFRWKGGVSINKRRSLRAIGGVALVLLLGGMLLS